MNGDPLNIHGTAIVLGGHGVLITGASGSGKSLLALDLLDQAFLRGDTARLVSDDRVLLSDAGGGRLVMETPPAIEGLIELRGRGIVSLPFIASAPLHLVVDLVDDYERMVPEAALETRLLGVVVARCPVPRRGLVDPLHQRLLVRIALENLGGGPGPEKT